MCVSEGGGGGQGAAAWSAELRFTSCVACRLSQLHNDRCLRVCCSAWAQRVRAHQLGGHVIAKAASAHAPCAHVPMCPGPLARHLIHALRCHHRPTTLLSYEVMCFVHRAWCMLLAASVCLLAQSCSITCSACTLRSWRPACSTCATCTPPS